jgi:hypothetical protein
LINQDTHTTEGRVVATWGATNPGAYAYDVFGRMVAMATTREPAQESVNILTILHPFPIPPRHLRLARRSSPHPDPYILLPLSLFPVASAHRDAAPGGRARHPRRNAGEGGAPAPPPAQGLEHVKAESR